MSDKNKRAIITYVMTRGYYPDSYRNYSNIDDAVDEEIAKVGQIQTAIIGPYSKLSTVKAQVKSLIGGHRGYPFSNVYGDGLKSFDIISIHYEEATITWQPI